MMQTDLEVQKVMGKCLGIVIEAIFIEITRGCMYMQERQAAGQDRIAYQVLA